MSSPLDVSAAEPELESSLCTDVKPLLMMVLFVIELLLLEGTDDEASAILIRSGIKDGLAILSQ